MIQFKSQAEQATKSYEFLWISEKFYLQGLCAFLTMAKTSPQRNLNQLA